MAKTDYARIAEGALKQLDKDGMPVTLHKKTAPDPDAPFVPGQPIEPLVVDYAGTGAVFGYKVNYIDGTVIQHGDQRCLLAPQIEAEPKTGDTLTAGSATYNVIAVERVAPAGVPVLYKLQLRGV